MSARSKMLYGHLRTRLLGFSPMVGSETIQSLLTGGLHTHSAPDNATYPFGFLMIRTSAGNLDDADLEKEGQLEASFVCRGRGQFTAISDAMDIAEEALLKYLTEDVGWFMVRELLTRADMPAHVGPANAELIQVRAVWRFTWWPTYRSQYATPAGSPAPSSL